LYRIHWLLFAQYKNGNIPQPKSASIFVEKNIATSYHTSKSVSGSSLAAGYQSIILDNLKEPKVPSLFRLLRTGSFRRPNDPSA
jgi:CRISPR/Cas system-associated protein Cas7 (RAMP superfamily)